MEVTVPQCTPLTEPLARRPEYFFRGRGFKGQAKMAWNDLEKYFTFVNYQNCQNCTAGVAQCPTCVRNTTGSVHTFTPFSGVPKLSFFECLRQKKTPKEKRQIQPNLFPKTECKMLRESFVPPHEWPVSINNIVQNCVFLPKNMFLPKKVFPHSDPFTRTTMQGNLSKSYRDFMQLLWEKKHLFVCFLKVKTTFLFFEWKTFSPSLVPWKSNEKLVPPPGTNENRAALYHPPPVVSPLFGRKPGGMTGWVQQGGMVRAFEWE